MISPVKSSQIYKVKSSQIKSNRDNDNKLNTANDVAHLFFKISIRHMLCYVMLSSLDV